MIAVCTPSRGLIFSKCVQGIIEGMQSCNAVGIATKYFTSHDLPIPDSHNFCVEQAFQNPAVKKILFIEEDMYVFPDAFVALATSDEPIVTLQYNDRNGSVNGIIHYNEAHEIIWCGLGATAIKREVFEALGAPFFRTDTRYKIHKKPHPNGGFISTFEEIEPKQVWSEEEGKTIEVKDHYKYGGLDVDFYSRARKLGYKIVCLPEYKAHQFELVQLGEKYINNGCHTIKQV